MTPTKPHTGLVELHLAVLLFGGTALFSKLIPLSALNITFLRCIIAAMVLAAIIKAAKHPLRLQRQQDYWAALALGTLVCLHWVTYFSAMQLSSVAIGMIAFFTYPVMTVLIEPLINKTQLKPVDVISAIAVLAGVIMLIPEANLNNDTTLGIIVGIISAALFTSRNLLHKRVFSQYSGPHAMFYQTLITLILLSPWQDVAAQHISQTTWGLILLLGIVFTALPHALFTTALRFLSAKTVGLVSCLQPFYGAVLALLILDEQLTTRTLIGGTIIVATALFETQQSHQKSRA
ncbi:DMT family transporter [Shewanella frigidimarina]|uniref:DMT family transporter n=1 Tax=Shewanella frigidimarina TaxID=56812 RepID=UPI000F50ED92|nr:DMT family transporter [Shewanella frigidimarina]RPA33789.1 EamA/RhaT family transporter [Shewanella frigidimarina]